MLEEQRSTGAPWVALGGSDAARRCARRRRPAAPAPERRPARPTRSSLKRGSAAGAGQGGLRRHRGARRQATVEVVATAGAGRQAAGQGHGGHASSATSAARPPSSSTRACSATTAATTTSGPTGTTPYVGRDASGKKRLTLYQELRELARQHPDIVKAEVIGRTVNDVPILAYKVTRNARDLRDGARPGRPLLVHAARARVDRAPRTNRRLVQYVRRQLRQADRGRQDRRRCCVNAASCGSCRSSTPTATTTPSRAGNRLWRKNLRDNNGDGADHQRRRRRPQPQLRRRSGTTTSRARRRTRPPRPSTAPARPRSPRSRRCAALRSAIRFKFQIDYHSFAQLILYPRAGRSRRRRPTRRSSMAALAGNDDNPAVDGLRPRRARRALHDQRRRSHDQRRRRSTRWPTPSSSTAARPDGRRHGRHRPDRCTPGGFVFQDSEADIAGRVRRRTSPFALDLAKSADDPAELRVAPGQHRARLRADDVPDLLRRSADGRGQRQARARRGAACTGRSTAAASTAAPTTRVRKGGERYGAPGVYYHRLRGEVPGAKPGDKVEVWFAARKAGKRSSRSPTRSKSDTATGAAAGGRGLHGLSSERARPRRHRPAVPRLLQGGAATTPACGYDVYDVDANGRTAPDRPRRAQPLQGGGLVHGRRPLRPRARRSPGGTGHVEARRRRDPRRPRLPERGRQAARDRQAALQGAWDQFLYNPLGPTPPYCSARRTRRSARARWPTASAGPDDFLQYWLGRLPAVWLGADLRRGRRRPAAAAARDAAVRHARRSALNGADSAENQEHLYSFLTTSSILPGRPYPQFESDAGDQARPAAGLRPADRAQYVRVRAGNDASYKRLTPDGRPDRRRRRARTCRSRSPTTPSRTSTTCSSRPTPSARTTGRRCPTPTATRATDIGGCPDDIVWRHVHPFLAHYQTNTTVAGAGGRGLHDHRHDRRVERGDRQLGRLPGLEGRPERLRGQAGRGLDHLRQRPRSRASACSSTTSKVTTDGQAAERDVVRGRPRRLEAGPARRRAGATTNDWQRSKSVGYVDGPGVATPTPLYWGFGLEGVDEQRAADRGSCAPPCSTSARCSAARGRATFEGPPPGGPSSLPLGGAAVRGALDRGAGQEARADELALALVRRRASRARRRAWRASSAMWGRGELMNSMIGIRGARG